MTRPCRRCHRPLSSALAVAAGIGARCALLDLAEPRPAGGPTAAQTAVALVSAQMSRVDRDTYAGLLAGADTAEVAGLLAACAAIVLDRTPGGAAWLAGLGLAAAEVSAA